MKQVTEEQKEQLANEFQTYSGDSSPEDVTGEDEPASATGDVRGQVPQTQQRVIDLLGEKWRVRERPFVSSTPLIGSFIARFREAWNSVSTKWYVRALFQQQNEFNALVVQRLEALESFEDLTASVYSLNQRLGELREIVDELDARVIDTDRNGTVLAREVAELTYALIRVEKQMLNLERRLERLSLSEEQES